MSGDFEASPCNQPCNGPIYGYKITLRVLPGDDRPADIRLRLALKHLLWCQGLFAKDVTEIGADGLDVAAKPGGSGTGIVDDAAKTR